MTVIDLLGRHPPTGRNHIGTGGRKRIGMGGRIGIGIPGRINRNPQTRFEGRGLVASIDGILMDVRDISIGGAKVARSSIPLKGDVSITLHQRGEHRLDLTGSTLVTGSVVHAGKDATHLRFETATFALSKLIVAHASRQLGIAPYSVK